MDAWVVTELGVKCGGHNFSLPDENGVTIALGENFDVGTDAFDARRADVDLLEWLGPKLGIQGEDGGVDLAPVGVSSNSYIDGV